MSRLLTPIKQLVKCAVFRQGPHPARIRGGSLRGRRMLLDLRHDTQVWRGVYEQSLQEWLTANVTKDAVCFDVGAAEGWATLQMALLATGGRVFAFEPSDRGNDIRPNLDLNRDRPLAEVQVERCYVGRENCHGSTSIPTRSIDAYIAENALDRLDVIKIDVDGPELEVLDGAMQALERHHPAICVETHSRELTQAVVARLASLGYATRVEEPPKHEHRPIGDNPSVFGEFRGVA
ncbi:hypothetical protein Pla108_21190 [Botrimarina colliarenosi]|uniref:Methyltransferase FkbM domain-containing protein n=1 Tax=Botrimarina colliarenosi TaxID=2528001 RepID=A0A5C6ADC4_9BACT|nr:FkbM family methyltransferase [Botrimarina colliarenosi]TWT97964.1 hypothetical protein Pla108_21190 [Botrimarina colliarenosi]